MRKLTPEQRKKRFTYSRYIANPDVTLDAWDDLMRVEEVADGDDCVKLACDRSRRRIIAPLKKDFQAGAWLPVLFKMVAASSYNQYGSSAKCSPTIATTRVNSRILVTISGGKVRLDPLYVAFSCSAEDPADIKVATYHGRLGDLRQLVRCAADMIGKPEKAGMLIRPFVNLSVDNEMALSQPVNYPIMKCGSSSPSAISPKSPQPIVTVLRRRSVSQGLRTA